MFVMKMLLFWNHRAVVSFGIDIKIYKEKGQRYGDNPRKTSNKSNLNSIKLLSKSEGLWVWGKNASRGLTLFENVRTGTAALEMAIRAGPMIMRFLRSADFPFQFFRALHLHFTQVKTITSISTVNWNGKSYGSIN